jgi:hypothetical protein
MITKKLVHFERNPTSKPLMILFSFTEREASGQAAPILTVPTN